MSTSCHILAGKCGGWFQKVEKGFRKKIWFLRKWFWEFTSRCIIVGKKWNVFWIGCPLSRRIKPAKGGMCCEVCWVLWWYMWLVMNLWNYHLMCKFVWIGNAYGIYLKRMVIEMVIGWGVSDKELIGLFVSIRKD